MIIESRNKSSVINDEMKQNELHMLEINCFILCKTKIKSKSDMYHR
jgi:hypothetical protein